jgi:ferredoxin
MARLPARLDENAPGPFFVDDSCIDCGACREIAPATFGRSHRLGQSFVTAQPVGGDGELRALMAWVACPTASLGTSPKRPLDAAIAAFPERLEVGIYYCGWHSEASYGASSYLIVRPGANVLVDSPRASHPLLERIAALGGVVTLSTRSDQAHLRTFQCKARPCGLPERFPAASPEARTLPRDWRTTDS